MYQISIKKCYFLLYSLVLFVVIGSVIHCDKSYALEIADHSYEVIYNRLPEKYQDSEYVYKDSNGIAMISFATYNGNPYRTSVKKKQGVNEYLYCVNYDRRIEFTDSYELAQGMFNNNLRTRLGIVFYHAPVKWGEKADAQFTTGNCILDYYMTQVVIHSLIYKYGGDDKSHMGIDFNKIQFKDGMNNLAKKTKAFYQYCCDATVKYTNGNFQTIDFKFGQPEHKNLYYDGENMVSPSVSCNINSDNASVASFKRMINASSISSESVCLDNVGESYDSDFRLRIPLSTLDMLDPSVYSVGVVEEIQFNRKKAGLWQCIAEEYVDTSQEVACLIEEDKAVSDSIMFDFVIGSISLLKKDSITGEEISDAEFHVLQFNVYSNQYEYYKTMMYDTGTSMYESGNLYTLSSNPDGRYKIIEARPGNQYLMDWNGYEFTISSSNYIHEIIVENQPILGELTVKKTGEKWSFEDLQWSKDEHIALPNVKFSLYALEDIYVKDKQMYSRDMRIADLITLENGEVHVRDLPMGQYYIKEITTLDDYHLNTNTHYFEITRDNNRTYSKVNLSIENELKTSQIRLTKYYYDDSDKEEKNPIPLKGAQFGLYMKNDYCDVAGNIIVQKDTCLAKEYSDKDGKVTFDHIPYTEYYIKELEAPPGFILNDGIVTVTLSDYKYDANNNIYVCEQDIINQKQRFQLSIAKTGDSFSGYEVEETQHGNYVSYQIGNKKLSDVEFLLYNDNNEILETKSTDNNGHISFDNLTAGTYYLCENKVSPEYELNTDKKKVVIDIAGKEYNPLSPPVKEEYFHNELCKTTIELKKLGEEVFVENDSLAYREIPLSNIVFGIYQKFDYSIAGTEEVLPQGTCVGFIITNEDGIGSYTNKLPCGSYYLKELITHPGYDLDETEYSFEVRPDNNQEIQVVLNENNTFYNLLSKASVKIHKTDAETGKSIKNVEFTLYNHEDIPIGVYKTNNKGEIIVENLPYGSYYFVETKSKNGYYSTNNKFHFTLDSDEMVTLDITNSPILKLGFNEHYKSALWVTIFVIIVFFGLSVASYYIAMHKKNE